MQALSLMALEPPIDPSEFAEWLRELKVASGLSFNQIAQLLGEEVRNVKRWMPVKGTPHIPNGHVTLRLLIVFGVRMDQPVPNSVAPLQFELERVTAALKELEETFTSRFQQAEDTAAGRTAERNQNLEEVEDLATEGLARVEMGIARVEKLLAGEEPQSHEEEGR